MNHPTIRKRKRRNPWWAHVLIAGILYIGLTYYVPTLRAEDQRIVTFLQILQRMAPIGAIGFLLLAAKALYDVDGPERKAAPPDDGENEYGEENGN